MQVVTMALCDLFPQDEDRKWLCRIETVILAQFTVPVVCCV